MKPRTCGLLAIAAFALGGLLGSAQSLAQTAYITNLVSGTVSMIDTVTNQVVGSPITVGLGAGPFGVAASPDGNRVYVGSQDNTVSVINTATNTVTATISVGTDPQGVAVSPDSRTLYVANAGDNTVSVIDTTTTTPALKKTISVGTGPVGVAVSPDGRRVYVGNSVDKTVTVIDANTLQQVVGSPITVGGAFGGDPLGVAVSPDSSRLYVANGDSVSVINTVTLLPVQGSPISLTSGGGYLPYGLAVTPDGKKVYVAHYPTSNVSVIDTTTKPPALTKTISVGTSPNGQGGGGFPVGVAVTPDGSEVYVANSGVNSVTVIGTQNDTVIVPRIPVGYNPFAFGAFISPSSPPGSHICQALLPAGSSESERFRCYAGVVFVPSYVAYLMSQGMSITQAMEAILSGNPPPVVTGRGPVPESYAAYLMLSGARSIILSFTAGGASSKRLADNGLKMMEQGLRQLRSLDRSTSKKQ